MNRMSVFRSTPLARIALAAALLAGVLLVVLAPPRAGAAFPGTNGRIIFTSDRDGDSEIYAMFPDGSGQTNVTNHAGDDGYPAWSPDGTRIVFTSFRDGNAEVYVMNADGSDQTNLTNDPAGDGYAVWSPDGTKIAFASNRDGDGEIWVMDADGSNPVKLTDNTDREVEPTWSPDGTKIAFTSNRDGNDDIFVMDANGGNQTNLTNTADGEDHADWSPDGTRIAYTYWDVGVGDIYVMDPNGDNKTNLTNSPSISNYEPAWSPDGTKILSSRLPGPGPCEIVVMNADGSGMTNLTKSRDSIEVEASWQPSPDAAFASTTKAGVTDDGLAFGPHDILHYTGTEWTKWFDGTAAGLTGTGTARHEINAFAIPNTLRHEVVMSFTKNARVVPGVAGRVDGMDLVLWDGDSFSLLFDGQDVGLTNLTQEKIDALHVLDGSFSPIGDDCQYYLLLSTVGPGMVPVPGGYLKFSGEDVLGFCLTNRGASTAGFWHKVLDGSDEGMPANSLNGLSASYDNQTLYVTTRGAFNVDSAVGGPSMIYTYELGAFGGPVFVAADKGLHQTMAGMQAGD